MMFWNGYLFVMFELYFECIMHMTITLYFD